MIYLRYKHTQHKYYNNFIAIEIERNDLPDHLKTEIDLYGSVYFIYDTEGIDYIINKYELPKKIFGDIVDLNYNNIIKNIDSDSIFFKAYINQKNCMLDTMLKNRNDKLKKLIK